MAAVPASGFCARRADLPTGLNKFVKDVVLTSLLAKKVFKKLLPKKIKVRLSECAIKFI